MRFGSTVANVWSNIQPLAKPLPARLSSGLSDPAAQRGSPGYLLIGHSPEANEKEKATLTDIIIPVWLAPARGPFCGVITVLSFTRHCVCHYFTLLRHPFVLLQLHHSNCTSFTRDYRGDDPDDSEIIPQH